MKKELLIFSAVVLVSVVTAHVCHTFFPGVAPAIKPLTWPVFYALYVGAKYAKRAVELKKRK